MSQIDGFSGWIRTQIKASCCGHRGMDTARMHEMDDMDQQDMDMDKTQTRIGIIGKGYMVMDAGLKSPNRGWEL